MTNTHKIISPNQMIDSFFNGNISNLIGADYISTYPAANIIELKDGYQIELAAPGLDKNDFEIKVDKNSLIIKANFEESSDLKSGTIKRKEYNYSNFTRRFTIDQTIDRSKIDATYENGILNVILGKKEEAIEKGPLHINIK